MTGSVGDVARLLDGPALALVDGAAAFLAGGAAAFGAETGAALGAYIVRRRSTTKDMCLQVLQIELEGLLQAELQILPVHLLRICPMPLLEATKEVSQMAQQDD